MDHEDDCFQVGSEIRRENHVLDGAKTRRKSWDMDTRTQLVSLPDSLQMGWWKTTNFSS